MRAVVVDDEPELRQQLVKMLSKFWSDLDVVAEVGDGLSAIEVIEQQRPDIAFLDIQMPGKSGLEVAKAVAGKTRVVFVTAYNQYAVDAFEREAVDYLLKPVSEQRLVQAIERIKRSLQNPVLDIQTQLQSLAAELAKQQALTSLKWIRASKGEVTHLIHIEDVLFFHAEDKYTTVVTQEGEFLIRKPIKELEDELRPEHFWRIHRSTIVNVSKIASSHREISGGFILKIVNSPHKLKVSRNYAYLFKQM